MSRISIILPVYNEEECLEKNTETVLKYAKKFYENFEIVITDNASIDKTLDIAKKLSKKYKEIRYIHLDQKGRGRVLKKAWNESKADILAYSDIDLSTDIKAIKKLTDAIDQGYDIATASRHSKQSQLDRTFKREILSKGYNFLLKLFLNTKISDAQCGFKAVNRRVVKEIIPLVKDNEWFFDTEMLILAERKGFRIKEIPVKWVEHAGSTVHIKKTVTDYLKSVFRLRKELSDENEQRKNIIN